MSHPAVAVVRTLRLVKAPCIATDTSAAVVATFPRTTGEAQGDVRVLETLSHGIVIQSHRYDTHLARVIAMRANWTPE